MKFSHSPVGLALALLLSLSLNASAMDYGRYSLRASSDLPEGTEVMGTETPELYKNRADRPAYYELNAPAGEYEVIVHYVTVEDNNGEFSVVVDGQEMVSPTPCLARPDKKNPTKTTQAQQAKFPVKKEGNAPLRIHFTGPLDKDHAIAGLEVLNGSAHVRINCGGEEITDAQGNTWLADQELPMEQVSGDVEIQLDAIDTKNEWVDIGTEMVDKMTTAGAVPLPKWGGKYTRHVNALILDRSGNAYVNFAALGLWNYPGPGGTMTRADDQGWQSVTKGEALNPYGPGFVLFCSHGYGPKEEYQILSWDGKSLRTWPVDADFGAVDWQTEGTPLIYSKPRHNNILVISKDSGQTREQVAQADDIVNLGALGDGVLVYVLEDREGSKPEAGIYRSADLGKTWNRVKEGAVKARDVANCSTILAFKNRAYLHTANGLLKSDDRGKTWRLIPDTPAFEGAPLPAEDDTHMLAFSREGGFETFDQGETWQKIMPAPPVAEKQKWLQSHRYYNFAWDHEDDVIYAYAPDAVYRFDRVK